MDRETYTRQQRQLSAAQSAYDRMDEDPAYSDMDADDEEEDPSCEK